VSSFCLVIVECIEADAVFFIRYSYIIRHIKEWYTSPVANPSDPSLAAYAVSLLCSKFFFSFRAQIWSFMNTGIATDSLAKLRVPLQRNGYGFWAASQLRLSLDHQDVRDADRGLEKRVDR